MAESSLAVTALPPVDSAEPPPGTDSLPDATHKGSAKQNDSSSRDLRIDFFRGFALLVMAIDHGEQLAGKQILSYVTYAPIGVSTAAEVFVFLSGLTLGVAYYKVFLHHGYILLHARCLFRAWQLYIMHVFMLGMTVFAIWTIPSMLGSDPTTTRVGSSVVVSNTMLSRFVTLQANPTFFDILPLYVVFLVVLPPLFILLHKSIKLGLLVSLVLYLVPQYLIMTGNVQLLPFYGKLYYEPLAWQLLFSIGLAIGIGKQQGVVIPRLSVRALSGLIVSVLAVGVWYKLVRLNVLFGWVGSGGYEHGMSIPFDIPLIDKTTLGPMRLAHFLVTALIASQLLPQGLRVWKWNMSKVLMTCGKHSLEVFVAGVVLNYAAAAAMQSFEGGRAAMVLLDFITLGLLVLIAYLVSWKKSNPWSGNRSQCAG